MCETFGFSTHQTKAKANTSLRTLCVVLVLDVSFFLELMFLMFALCLDSAMAVAEYLGASAYFELLADTRLPLIAVELEMFYG